MNAIRISLFMGLLWAARAKAEDPAALAQRAIGLQQSGQYAEAAEAYRSLLEQLPNDVTTHVNFGVVLVKLGRYDEAIAQYEAAEKLLPGDPRIELNIALAEDKGGHVAEARKRFEQLHAADPGNAQVTMLLADSLLSFGDNQGVVTLLEPLKDSQDPGVSYMLGIALLRLHRESEAQVYLDRILRNGDTAEARFLLGARMFEAGDYPSAVKQLAGAIQLDPGLPQLQELYGRALLDTGDPDAALQAFRKEMASNPTAFMANLGTAQILAARKQFATALPSAQQAIGLHPESADAQLVLAQCLAGEGQFATAKTYAEQAVSANPNSIESHRTLASVYRGLHQVSASVREESTADSLAAAADPGPRPGEPAPGFALADANGTTVRLSDFRGKSPVALIFGSYSCPNFRASAEALRTLQLRYGSRVPFLLVYIREAHAAGQWQSTRNQPGDAPLEAATTMAEKETRAGMCSRKLHLSFPALADKMDGAVEAAYNAWPSRAFIVGADGRIAYSTRLTELDFSPERMEAALQRVMK